ncbi:TPA: sigma-54-dependent Fis family transcriptional regulator, partial [Acinetobacter baumannii]|nr:sigma-54-dependent Fis family transcriptional regulator [Acinetobacter baumannii]HCW6220795.1 sigma-54-dependent Fis family transcriptional regulator [Acinetobacter baumannii]HCW6228892.1 sigma-54-dependent Fis family transcriptional regulator [Acinetobacter baumannii]HCW6232910.1 sigma-54-dependent Fis family transcriptional regulator [Acinetobacter baumannii]HCW6235966.1 sigma-54-dependent Fis family transcriptional regulator [Acinetobacter baumannii]
IFSDQNSRKLLNQVETIAPSSASVIIQGESGTGKELIAREIHLKSDRKNKPFLAVNCGALVETLAESELFGYEAGAFTGANKTRAGIFETADGGTLFLDEVGELPLSLQVKLLRVLQEKEVVRVGGRKPIPINVRILSGTHVDLRKAVAENKFRLDLYYRLNVVVLNILPLRERKGDILPLVDFFLSSYSQKLITTKPNISDRARNALLNYSWPGNIRELENNIHYALLVSGGKTIDLEHLRFSEETGSAVLPDNDLIQEFESILKRLFQEYDGEAWHIIEDKIVNTAFSSCWNNQVKTAKMLGLSRNVLRNLLSRYNLLPNKNENEIA